MPQPNTVESWLQFGLQRLARDDISPAFFLGGRIDDIPDRTPQRWQLAVDMMYRCIVSGLIDVHTPRYRNDHEGFFHVLRTFAPYGQGDGMALWHGGDLCPTERLIDLLDKYFPKTGPCNRAVNPAFIQELTGIFAEHNVPWSDAPLLPIIRNDNSAIA
jgi:hypothetical protein